MVSKAVRENERYLARAKKSMEAEANARIARQKAQEKKEQDRLQRDADRRAEKQQRLDDIMIRPLLEVPPGGAHTHTVIMLHGCYCEGTDFETLPQLMQELGG